MSRRILIIEDEDDIREVAKLALEVASDWEVLAASSGAEGVAIAEEERPDGILLDVMMPGMDGPETLRELRSRPATGQIPVVFLTAKVHQVDRARFGELGVDGVIAKPFDPMTLADEVAEVFGW